MLKIREDFNLKELEKYKIYPRYMCNEITGETKIECLSKDIIYYQSLKFIRKSKRIAILNRKNENIYELVINDKSTEIIDLDTLYDLIKEDIVIKE